jgi:hypothetical protein
MAFLEKHKEQVDNEDTCGDPAKNEHDREEPSE